MKSRLAIVIILVIIAGLVLPTYSLAEFTSLPLEFEDEQVVGGVPSPTAIDWLPASEDDDLVVTSQLGGVFRVSDAGTAVSILDLSGTICFGGERGLLGLAVDPAFAAGERFIYLYYTDRQEGADCGADNRANRVSRFTMNDAGALVDERVLIDNIPAPNGNHNGGDLQFDNAGLLYVSVGDGGADLQTGERQNGNGNARRLDLLNGKILRIETDGGIPAGNPFQGSGTASCAATGGLLSQADGIKAEKKSTKKKRKAKKKKQRKQQRRKQRRRNRQDQDQGPPPQTATMCQEIFATGLRNPFRIAFDPNDTSGAQRFYINDVGGGAWEEIDAGAPGADYGWNVREGPCPTGTVNNCAPDNRFVEPIFAYRHQNQPNGCRTITGGAFVPEAPAWSAYAGVYLYADFLCGKVFVLRNQTPGQSQEEFASGTGATHLAFGPDGDLYYTTFESDGVADGGQVRRIVT